MFKWSRSSQNRVVRLLKTRGDFELSQAEAINFAKKIDSLSLEKFNQLMEVSYKNNCFGATCYKFLNQI